MIVNDEKIYGYVLYVLLVFEGLLSIPLLIDSFVGTEGQNIIIAVAGIHAITWFLAEVWRTERLNKTIHMTGLIASLGSLMPFVGFVLHVVVVYLIFRDILQESRKKRYEEKEVIK